MVFLSRQAVQRGTRDEFFDGWRMEKARLLKGSHRRMGPNESKESINIGFNLEDYASLYYIIIGRKTIGKEAEIIVIEILIGFVFFFAFFLLLIIIIFYCLLDKMLVFYIFTFMVISLLMMIVISCIMINYFFLSYLIFYIVYLKAIFLLI
jgi:hypothetical protein